MTNEPREKLSRPLLWAAVLVLGIATSGLSQLTPGADTQLIRDSLPLFRAATRIGGRYAEIVTYEDPLDLASGDIELTGIDPKLPMAWSQKTRVLRIPDTMAGAALPKPDAEALRGLLASYHRDNPDAPRFKVLESKYGLHIVPDQVRGEDGEWKSAASPLDTVITVPAALRMPSEHFQAISDAVAAAVAFKIRLFAPWIDQYYLPNGEMPSRSVLDRLNFLGAGPEEKRPYSFEWGANGVPAREALISLLQGSGTSLVWHFNIHPSPTPSNRLGIFNVVPLRVPVAQPDGTTSERDLVFDRCTKCPPLGALPPAVLPK